LLTTLRRHTTRKGGIQADKKGWTFDRPNVFLVHLSSGDNSLSVKSGYIMNQSAVAPRAFMERCVAG